MPSLSRFSSRAALRFDVSFNIVESPDLSRGMVTAACMSHESRIFRRIVLLIPDGRSPSDRTLNRIECKRHRNSFKPLCNSKIEPHQAILSALIKSLRSPNSAC